MQKNLKKLIDFFGFFCYYSKWSVVSLGRLGRIFKTDKIGHQIIKKVIFTTDVLYLNVIINGIISIFSLLIFFNNNYYPFTFGNIIINYFGRFCCALVCIIFKRLLLIYDCPLDGALVID